MSSVRLVPVVLLLAATAAFAGEPAGDKSNAVNDRIVIDCHTMQAPSLGKIARLIDTAEIWNTWTARAHLMRQVQERCRHGAGFVRLVPNAESVAVDEMRLSASSHSR
ncbi:hypothetical protein [Rudaea sp.]|uniref:hypothetical protein n=1 Tax=Rudaea sp. TaxID=2136325 RepID=UPI002ED5B98E